MDGESGADSVDNAGDADGAISSKVQTEGLERMLEILRPIRVAGYNKTVQLERTVSTGRNAQISWSPNMAVMVIL